LGFALLGSAGGRLARDFARAPPTRFATTCLAASRHRRPGVSIGVRLASTSSVRRTERQVEATRQGFCT